MCPTWLCFISGAVFAMTIVSYLSVDGYYMYANYISNITIAETINQACVNRVSLDPAALFDPSNLMFNPPLYREGNRTTFNSTLCNSGFVGNSDIYGLGVRSGPYILWISSLLATHLLP